MTALACDRILIGKDAPHLDRVIQILSFYLRHRMRKAITNLIDVIFVEKVHQSFLSCHHFCGKSECCWQTFSWLPASSFGNVEFTAADVHDFLMRLCDLYEHYRYDVVFKARKCSSGAHEKYLTM